MQKQILTEIELMLTSTLLPETCHVLGKKIVEGWLVILCFVQDLLKKGIYDGRGGGVIQINLLFFVNSWGCRLNFSCNFFQL